MTSPFEPPVAEREPASYGVLVVVGAWGLAGATVGTAVGTTLQLTQATAGASAGLGIGGMFLSGIIGAVALSVERARSSTDPEVVDGRGQRSRPLHAGLFVVPILAAVPALLWLVVIGSVGLGSFAPAVAFSMVAVGVLWAGRRVVGRHQLTRALQALEAGDVPRGTEGLRRIAEARWPTRGARSTARLNLAMLALSEGDLEGAARYYDGLSGVAGGWAAVGLALIDVLRGSHAGASEHLAEALTGPAARSVQPQADAVRVLLVWRTEGEVEARRIGEQLLGPAATPLHRALMASLRERAGDASGAAEVRTEEVDDLLRTGLGMTIPELRA